MSGLNERMKLQIALLAGEDLEAEHRGEVQRSVDSCPRCRRHWVRVRGCLDILERAGRVAEPAAGTSLWPAIEARLRPTNVVPARETFNGWVPALSMATACIALLVAGQMDGMAPPDLAQSGHDAPAVSRAGWQQVRWIPVAREEMQRRSARFVDPFRVPSAEMQYLMGPSYDRPIAPISWTYPDSGR